MNNKKNIIVSITTIFQIISLIIIVLCLYYIFMWFKNNKSTTETMGKVLSSTTITDEDIIIDDNTKINILNVDFSSITDINSDIIGWIKVPNTDINYPVVQTTDNSFYLTHSLDKTYNKAGWIFADYRNTNLKHSNLDKNTIIYGHNRENNSMFGTLKNLFKNDWQNNYENRYINFSTFNNSMVWEIFSTYTISDDDYYLKTQFSSDTEYQQFINTIKNRSIYNFNTEITMADKILTLSTCTNIGNGRAVVHAKLIK